MANESKSRYLSFIELGLSVVALVLTAGYIWSGLSQSAVLGSTANLPSTAQVNNQDTNRSIVVEESGRGCENGSLQTGTQAVPEAETQATASATQGNAGPSQSSSLGDDLQSRDSCNSSTQTTPLQPAGDKSDFEQFDNPN